MSTTAWPSLPLAEWQDTYATLHMWTQIVGKIRLARTPAMNHWWQVTLYVTSRGLTTSPIPDGSRTFQIDFDFIDHRLAIQASDGGTRTLPLAPRSVAAFYRALMAALAELGIAARIWPTPVEIERPIRFDQDEEHRSYDPEYARRWWQILLESDRVMKAFRARFLGKASPVHFFWGAFDLAVTRFSGRKAPPHPGAPNAPLGMVREAYSHEVSSCGFWPGGGPVPEPIYYAYAYPEPPGFKERAVHPAEAFYSKDLGEFVLPYEVVRRSASPDDTLLAFLQSTYEAAADLARWDRVGLERT
jgi:hypothetical protein